MANPDTDAIAPDIERPSPAELAPALTVAHGLTKREQVLTSFVCRGLSTAEIADRRLITPDTIDDHLKSIFDKTGVSTRREIVAAISKEQVPAEGDDGAAPRVVMGSGWRCTGASL
jgi:DNA-binding CsgD family transcriptional regulator